MSENVIIQCKESFESGFYCAESVIRGFAKAYGVDHDLLTRIATGFCSGVSRTSGMCGALSGAIMAIGLLKGRSSPDDPVTDTYPLVQRAISLFKMEFCSINCRDLVGCDLNTEEGQIYYKEHNRKLRCRHFTERGCRIALQVLKNEAVQVKNACAE